MNTDWSREAWATVSQASECVDDKSLEVTDWYFSKKQL